MPSAAPPPSARRLLSAAATVLASGELERARSLTVDAHAAAQTACDSTLAGRALALRAQVDIVDSHFRDALTWVTRALEALRAQGAEADRADALSLASYINSVLGHDAQAMRQGYLAVRLLDNEVTTVPKVKALNYLGVALFWAGHHDLAQNAFDEAIHLAHKLGNFQLAYHPTVNKACGEMARQLELRYMGVKADPTQLHGALAAGLAMAHSDQGLTLGAGTGQISLLLLDSLASIASSMSGDIASAVDFNAACQARLEHFSADSWMRTMALLAQCELLRAQGDFEHALEAAQSLSSQAERSQHLQMQYCARRIVSELHELKGDAPAALQARRLAERTYLVKSRATADAAREGTPHPFGDAA